MLSCLLVLELLLAAPPTGAPKPFHWKVPGVVSTVEVPARMDMGGIPVRLQVYTSRETVEYLLQHFATAADEAGLYLQRHQQRLVAEPHVTALDTRTLTSYTLVFQPEPGGFTSVVLGEARLGEAQPPAPAGAPPVYPGAVDVLHGNFEGARTIAYRVAAKEVQVRAWYREQFTRAGYTEESPCSSAARSRRSGCPSRRTRGAPRPFLPRDGRSAPAPGARRACTAEGARGRGRGPGEAFHWSPVTSGMLCLHSGSHWCGVEWSPLKLRWKSIREACWEQERN